MAHPVGTGPYMLKEWKRALAGSCSRPTPTIAASPGTSSRRARHGTTSSSRHEGQADAAGRPRRDHDHRRGRSRAGSRSSRRSSTRSTFRRTFSHQALDARQQAAARARRGRRHAATRSIDPDITYTIFNFRDPIVGGFTPDKIALRRAIIMGYDDRGGTRDRAQGPGGRGARCRSRPAWSATIRNYRVAQPLRPRHSPTSCSTTSATRRAPTATARCRTASRSCIKHATGATAIERELSELWKKSMDDDRHPHRCSTSQVRRQPEGGEGLPADDVGRGVDRRLSRRRQLHAAAVRSQHRPEQQRLLRVEGVRRVLREVARKLPESPERNRLFLEMSRQMEVDGAWRSADRAHAQPADPAVGDGLQEASDPAGRVACTSISRRIRSTGDAIADADAMPI